MKQPYTGHILVVDDDEHVRETLADLLEIDGHTTATATDGFSAVSQMRSQPFDLVLLDIMMPGMDGYQTLQLIKKDEELRHTPVVVISAIGDPKSAVRCIELGAEDMLQKPYPRTLLRARVKSSLEKKRLRDQEQQYLDRQQALYQEVKAADQAKSEFVAFVAHELRAPLSTLWAYAELIKRTGELNKQQQQHLRNMTFTIERMRNLITDLDDISRIETGNLGLSFQAIQVANFVEAAVTSLHTEIADKGHTILTEIEATLPTILADPARLMQILVNLISNAVKYTPDNGRITIAAHIKNDNAYMMHISIQDNGLGIAPQEQVHIFSKFFRSDSEAVKSIGGTGLGLNITQNLVEKQGGQIWFESELGQGTTFHFTIPVADTQK